MATPTKAWFIFDGLDHVDNEFYFAKEHLFWAINHESAIDLQVKEIDLAQARRGDSLLRDVTEEIAPEYWKAEGERHSWDTISDGDGAGKCSFIARRFYARQLAEWEGELYAADTQADARHAETVGA